jgi:hypothetical protein
MTDIPKMLRAEARIADEDWTGIYGISPNLAFAAADRIEKLEAALRLYACDCKPDDGCGVEYYDGGANCGRTARKALEGKDDAD